MLALGRLRGADVSAVAAEAAYFGILALGPFLIFLIAGVGFLSQFVPVGLVEDLERTITRMAPGQSGELLAPLFEEAIERTDRGTLSFGIFGSIVVAMWSGARAINGLLKGFRRICRETREPPFLWRRLNALFLSLTLGSVVVLSVAMFLFGGALGRGIANVVGLGYTFGIIWQVISWPLMAGIVVLILSLLYRLGGVTEPNGLRAATAGAVVAALLWLAVMAGIRIYVAIIDVGSLYGALGSFVVIVVFFYIMSLALLFGAAVDAVRRGRATREDDTDAEAESKPADQSSV
jgi:membrane protein